MPEGFDLQAFIEQGVKILAIFLFLVLPVVRSIREARRQAAEKQSKGSASTDAEPEASPELDGRKAWEALLRGETAAAPPAPPPIPAPLSPGEARTGESRVPKPVPLFDLEQHAPKMASAENLELERRSDEEGVAEAEIARRGREAAMLEREGARLEREAEHFEEDFARRQRTATSALSVEPATAPVGGAQLSTAAAFHPVAARKKRWARRADVRAAFVASEILGAPLALRRESHLPS